MSRSVKIPRRLSPSITSAEPARRSPMIVAASATVVERSTDSTLRVMTSPTVAMREPYYRPGRPSHREHDNPFRPSNPYKNEEEGIMRRVWLVAAGVALTGAACAQGGVGG